MIAFLLHHANRAAKNYPYLNEFYAIKDRLLKNAAHDGYDIQHIRGKRCHSCDGTGVHEKYSMYPPYKVYDTEGCWRCNGTGYYKHPQWICLQRVKFGGYIFHRPLKREYSVRNPWKEDVMGWEVSSRPVIEGYIKHRASWFGVWALLILFFIHDPSAFQRMKANEVDNIRWRMRCKLYRWKKIFTWEWWVIEKPKPFIMHYEYATGWSPIDPDLPF